MKPISEYLKDKKLNKRWRNFVFVCATLVITITICLLILPAITMESVLICDIEHEHVDSCYEQVPKDVVYVCGKSEHIHDETCYTEEVLSCTIDEHSHIDDCIEKTMVEEVISLFSTNEEITMDANNVATIEESATQTQPILFNDYITAVNLSYSTDGGFTWNEVTNGEVKLNDTLNFSLEYEIPGGVLSTTNNIITYKIPQEINLLNGFEDFVYNKSGVVIGTYTIDTDGNITISFYEEYATKNANGQSIVGNIGFTSLVSNLASDNSSNVVIHFNSKVSVEIDITDKYTTTGDLDVQKTSAIIDTVNNVVEYTILVSSQNVFTDNMTNGIKYYNNFKVVDKNGNQVVVSNTSGGNYTPNENDTTLNFQLPNLNANSSYTITYNATLSNDFNGEQHVINQIEATTIDNDGNKIKDSDNVTTILTKNMISKTAIQSETEDIINWTIEINKDNVNLNGYILNDVINNKDFNGEVLFTASDGSSFKATLPYTFGDTTNSYKITYTTTKDRLVGEQTVYNKATLLAPDGIEHISQKNVWTTGTYGGSYNPLAKEVNGNNFDNRELLWTVYIDTDNGEIVAPYTLEDKAEYGTHYYRKQDLEKLYQTLNSLGYNFDIVFYTSNNEQKTYSELSENVQYNRFVITFKDTLAKGKQLKFSYTSYVTNQETTSTTTFENKVTLNNKVSQKAKYVEGVNSVRKIDTLDTQGNPITYHEYYGSDFDSSDDDGLLYWTIIGTLPVNTNETIKIVDTLPEGLTIKKLNLEISNIFWGTNFVYRDNKWVLETSGYTIIAEQVGNVLTITLPKELVVNIKGTEIKTKIDAKINEDYEWQGTNNVYEGAFKNDVSFIDENNEEIGNATQTQIVTKNDNDKLLNKTANVEDGTQTSIIPYSIVVNPNGIDVSENSDIIQLNDTLNYYGFMYEITISLVPNSVKVYRLNSEGGKEELSSSMYSYNYTTVTPDENYNPHQNNISFDLPDNIPLVVEYSYKIYGEKGKAIYNLENSASLMTKNGPLTSSGSKISIILSSSAASADTKGFSIIKVDKNNKAIVLPNVSFNVYEWNGSEYVLVIEDGNSVFTTNEYGEIVIKSIKQNTAYKIVEISTLDGYLSIDPFYIIVNNSDTDTYPITIPNDFSGINCILETPLYVENERPITSIYVNKVWLDSNGVVLENPPDSITVELLRYAIPSDIYATIPKGDINLSVNYGASKWQIWNEEEKVIKSNSFVRLYIDFNSTSWKDNIPTVTLNGNILELQNERDDNYDNGEQFIYEFIPTEDGVLNIYTNDYSQEYWNYTIEIIESNESVDFDYTPYKDETYIESIVLNKNNNWEYTWKSLSAIGKNNNNEYVYYVYYVKENPLTSYKAEITKNSNISYTITNKQINVDNQYELPSTGGIGLRLYLTLAFIFVIIILFLLWLNNKKK